MRVFLFLVSVFSFLVGLGIIVTTEGAIHEIEGFLFFVISAVLLSGAAVVESLKPLKKSEAILGLIATGLAAQTEVLDEISAAVAKAPQAAPPAPGHEKYYVAIDGQATGPYDIPEIRALAKRGSIDGSMKVAKVGDKIWQPLSSLLG